MKTNKEYTAPELTVVGPADEVVMGSLGAGNDLRSEVLIPDGEFPPGPWDVGGRE